MLQLEVLVLKLSSVDGLSAGSIVVGEVTTLEHELGNDTMERRLGETEALLVGAESSEVLGGLGGHIGKELCCKCVRLRAH